MCESSFLHLLLSADWIIHISYGAFLHLISTKKRYPQVIVISSDDCVGLTFFQTKISALALQTQDEMECLFFKGLVR